MDSMYPNMSSKSIDELRKYLNELEEIRDVNINTRELISEGQVVYVLRDQRLSLLEHRLVILESTYKSIENELLGLKGSTANGVKIKIGFLNDRLERIKSSWKAADDDALDVLRTHVAARAAQDENIANLRTVVRDILQLEELIGRINREIGERTKSA